MSDSSKLKDAIIKLQQARKESSDKIKTAVIENQRVREEQAERQNR